MKRFLCLVFSIVLLVTISMPAFASESSSVLSTKKIDLGSGITLTEEIILGPQTRATERAATQRLTIDNNGVVLAVIAFRATFRYDGTTVSVVSKSVIQTDTYEGWNYKQTSFTSSGGTVTLTGKITKLLVLNHPFTLTLSCDKDGNIT